MAGHSKWANIKHKKERADAQKGKIFSRIAKEIISAVKQGGADPKGNVKLRLALQKAKAANVPSEVISRNIKKASSADQKDYVELMYEIYGYGGVGILVQAMTDNKNRTASDIRIAIHKKGGSLAAPGSVSFNFEQKGVLHICKNDAAEEEALFLKVTDLGAEDFESGGDHFIVITPAEKLYEIKEALEMDGASIEEADLEMLPKVMIECDPSAEAANRALIDFLENLDDIDAAFHNMGKSGSFLGSVEGNQ